MSIQLTEITTVSNHDCTDTEATSVSDTRDKNDNTRVGSPGQGKTNQTVIIALTVLLVISVVIIIVLSLLLYR